MKPAEALPPHQLPYEGKHVRLMMNMDGFKELPQDVQTLTRQLESLAEQGLGITQKLLWPEILMPQIARLRAGGDSENVRFLNPFAFLYQIEQFLIQYRKQQQLLK